MMINNILLPMSSSSPWSSFVDDPLANFVDNNACSSNDNADDDRTGTGTDGGGGDATTTTSAAQMDDLNRRKRRHQFLVSSMEASGIACAEHLQELSLEQLEEIYKMSGSYDDEHYHSNNHYHRRRHSSSSPDPSDSYSDYYHYYYYESPFLDSMWKFVNNSADEHVWLTFFFPKCFNLFPASKDTHNNNNDDHHYFSSSHNPHSGNFGIHNNLNLNNMNNNINNG